MTRFRVLGSLEVLTPHGWTSIGASKWRAVLACLLLHPGQIVSTDTLIEELWGDGPPARAANLVSIYVHRLRRLIGDTGQVLATRAPGYQIRLSDGDLDAQQFETLMGSGREALAAGDPGLAARLLAEGLALWQGRALADVPPSPFIDAEAERLEELRLAAQELRIEADLARGRHREVIPELRRLLADERLREKLWLLLMRALDGAGRRAEALNAYERARAVIADQLGVDPGPEIRAFFQQMLTEDAAQAPPAGARQPTPPRGRGPRRPRVPGPAAGEPEDRQPVPGHPEPPGTISLGTVGASQPPGEDASQAPGPGQVPVPPPRPEPGPMQLPADIADFTGREAHVKELCGLLAVHAADSPGAVPVALVAGAGGLGKTTLAIHAAHRMRSHYPDGQLYVDLLGSAAHPLAPADVLARFLRDLGVRGTQIPVGLEERAALYRTRLDGRRMLIVLDNARDAAQVRPLLPGTAACAVLITSRSSLPDLVGGRLVHLDVLDGGEALTLFSRIVGAGRTAAEPEATADLLRACAGLPLAIRISAARLAARSGWTIRSLADRISDQHRRLDELRVGDLAVRASFEVSFTSLPAEASPGGVSPAHVFRMLGLWQGPSIGLSAAAALLGEPEQKVADVLEFLVDAHLLESPGPDRYAFHDLLRVYAAERAAAEEPGQASQDAIRRVLAWYLHTAAAADTVVSPHRERVPVGPRPPGCQPLAFREVAQALRWCEAERANLVAATRQAAESGSHDIAWKLPVALLGCFDTLSYRAEWLASHHIALTSARLAGDQQGEGWALNNLGMVYSQQHVANAIDCLEQALAIRREIGDRRGEAVSTNNLADAYLRLGRTTEALGHFERTLALQRETGYRYGEGVALTNLGEAHLDLGSPDRALGFFEEARKLFVEISTTHNGEDYALDGLGRAYLSLGKPDEAISCFQRALALRRAAGDRPSQALTLMFLGRAHRHVGDLGRARESWLRACAIFEAVDDKEELAEVRSELSAIDSVRA